MSSPIAATSSSTTPPVKGQGKSTLDMTDFLKLLTTELQFQDPSNPMSSTDFYAQLAQMGTVQGINNLQTSAQMTQAASLIGKTVSGAKTAPDGSVSVVTGTVTGVSLNSGVYSLSVNDGSGATQTLNLSAVTSIGQ